MSHSGHSLKLTFARAWRSYTHRVGAYQMIVLASIVYYVLLGPSAFLGRLFGVRLLDTDVRERTSYWLERPKPELTLAEVERQF